MDRFVLDSEGLQAFLESTRTRHEVVGPVARTGGQHSFQVIQDLKDLVLDYVHTILPPKKFLHPQHDPMLTFRRDDPAATREVSEVKPRVIVGVHPCDLTGIRHLDLVFGESPTDQRYLARRRAALLIGVDCFPDDFCFCESVGTLRPRTGFDLFLLDLGDRWLVTVGTEEGGKLLAAHASTHRPAGRDEDEAEEAHYQEKRDRQRARLHADAHDLPMIFEGAFASPAWTRHGEKCLGCGTCTNVCPTCYCFDIRDEVGVDLVGGTRERVWDSCQLRDFTRVAGNEVFRDRLSLRVRHRVYRKFRYLHRKYNEPNCTGCGRCSRQCVAGIHIHQIVNDVVAASLAKPKGGGA